MSKIIERTRMNAERIVFDTQDVETDWAYMRVGYADDSPFQKFNWLKAGGDDGHIGFTLIIDSEEDQRLEAIYQEHLKERQQ